MAMVTCPDCENSVSSAAPACPHCGRPNPGGLPVPLRAPAVGDRSPGRVVAGIIVPGLVLMGLAGWGAYQFFRPMSASHARSHQPVAQVDSALAPPVSEEDLADAREMQRGADSVAGELNRSLDAAVSDPELINRDEVAAALSRNYPSLLRDAGVTGLVAVRMRVGADGAVDGESMTIQSSTHRMFSAAALNVAREMRFRPARVGGKPLPVWVTIPLTFQLEH